MNFDVLKFGGSSLACKQAIDCAKKIVNKKGNKIIVVSAFGKKDNNDVKLTDLLIACTKKQNDFKSEYKKVEKKVESIAKELNIKYALKKCLKKIKKDYIKTKNYDFLISRGEYITAKILAEYFCLSCNFLFSVDAHNIIAAA